MMAIPSSKASGATHAVNPVLGTNDVDGLQHAGEHATFLLRMAISIDSVVSEVDKARISHRGDGDVHSCV